MFICIADFQDVLAELDDILKKATFLAIDGEFTGLNSGPDANAYDTPAQYYAKLRSGSMDFLLVQFGLAVFTFNSENNKYDVFHMKIIINYTYFIKIFLFVGTVKEHTTFMCSQNHLIGHRLTVGSSAKLLPLLSWLIKVLISTNSLSKGYPI